MNCPGSNCQYQFSGGASGGTAMASATLTDTNGSGQSAISQAIGGGGGHSPESTGANGATASATASGTSTLGLYGPSIIVSALQTGSSGGNGASGGAGASGTTPSLPLDGIEAVTGPCRREPGAGLARAKVEA